MNVIVDGLMVNYQKTGQGQILLMIPGWGDSAKTFDPIIELLKDSYQIVALDLPGFGGSQPPSEAWGVQDFVDFVNGFVIKTRLKPYGVLGHSFGGSVAMKLAVQRPNFKKLILLASAGIRNKNPVRSKFIELTAKTGKGALYALPARKRTQLKRRLYGAIGSDALMLPHMEATYRRIIKEDARGEADRIKLPTLLIYGTADKETPPADGLILHKLIMGSNLQIIKAGHFLHQEHPEAVADLINGFLNL